ncbi:unnamed protein product [Bursaphelenchus okinawaensis]|uniref:Uncharacterized protein n=1 Tax=Bursaphelenchus okinawaensis TaxID=465554 RepID=A0A811L133_9BILA|nr:unnamed protein product [Bursaphelenchus okinawaensis]CAG9115603.1 unnamed protein product [Bursaphelenchus okinawaensis]
MGSEFSKQTLKPQAEKHIAITIERPDVLTLMDFDGEEGIVYKTLTENWMDEVTSCQQTLYFYCFLLAKKPFNVPILMSINNTEYIRNAVRARHSFCDVLSKLDDLGVKLLTTAYFGKTFTRTTLVLQRDVYNTTSESYSTRNVDELYICVAIRSNNAIIIPATAGLCRFPISWIQNEFGQMIVKADINDDFVDFTFKDDLFSAYSITYENMIHGKRMFLGLIRQLAQRGYEYVAPISIKGCTRNDTFYFKMIRQPVEKDKTYFFISPEEKNRLRLYETPPIIAEFIKKTISRLVLKEVKRPYLGCTEIIFAGQPFMCNDRTLLLTQIDMLEIIESLRKNGFKLVGHLQTTLNVNEKAVMLFESTNEKPVPIFAISFQGADVLQVLKAPIRVVTLIREAICNVWQKAIQEESIILNGTAFKLKGRPFAARDTSIDCQHGLHMLIFIIEKLSEVGWKFKIALDVGSRATSDSEIGFLEDGIMMIFEANLSSGNGEGKVYGVG